MPGWAWNYNMDTLAYAGFADLCENQWGMWPVSLSMHPILSGSKVFPRYTGVWHWRPQKPVLRRLFLATGDDLNEELPKWADDGFFPRLVSAYQVGNQPFYSVVGWKGPMTQLRRSTPVTNYLTPFLPDALGKPNAWNVTDFRYETGWHPVSLCLYNNVVGGVVLGPWQWPQSARVASIWEKQPAKRGQNGWYHYNILIDHENNIDDVRDVLRQGFGWSHVACPLRGVYGEGNRHLVLYRDDEIKEMWTHFSVPRNLLEPLVEAYANAAFFGSPKWPLSIQGTRYGSGQVFDVVFAEVGHENEKVRELTRRYPVSQYFKWVSADKVPGESMPAGQMDAQAGAPEMSVPPRSTSRAERGQELHFASEAFASPLSTLASSEVIQVPSSIDAPEPTPPMMLLSSSGQPPTNVPQPAPLKTVGVFHALEEYVVGIMKRYSIRGAQIAVVKNDQLKHTVGLTWADDDYPVTTPTMRMRIASLTKPITAASTLLVAEKTNFNIFTTSAATLLSSNQPGWNDISIAHLMTHQAFFSEDAERAAFDLLGMANDLQLAAGAPTQPIAHRGHALAYVDAFPVFHNIGWFSDTPPPYGPTTTSAMGPGGYSNFGYERLADVVTKRESLQPQFYQDWVNSNLFGPLGIPTTRATLGVHLAANAPAAAQEGVETLYHPSRPGWGWSNWHIKGQAPSLYQYRRGPPCYEGGNYWPLLLGAGGWAMAAADYARFLSGIDSTGPIFQDPASVAKLFEEKYVWGASLGFGLHIVSKKVALTHIPDGAVPLPGHPDPRPDAPPPGSGGEPTTHQVADFAGGSWGTVSYAFRRDDGVVLVLIYNHGVAPTDEPFYDLETLSQLLDIPDEAWPAGDLFPNVSIDV